MTDKFKFDPEHTFFTSDTHFGHANIINLCNRPFKDVNHMNDMLVENWNSVVSDEETDDSTWIGEFDLRATYGVGFVESLPDIANGEMTEIRIKYTAEKCE